MSDYPHWQGQLKTGAHARLEALSPTLFRVRLDTTGQFREPSLNRYGVLSAPTASIEAEIQNRDGRISLNTSGASVEMDAEEGKFTLKTASGEILTGSGNAPWCNFERGFGAEFALRPEETFYGLGDVTRDRVQMRGHRAQIWVRNVAAYSPSPWLMSTGGWGVFFNTTWRHVWDVGARNPDVIRVNGRRGSLDIYLFVGPDLPDLLEQFTALTGRPALLPQWAYGFTFVCNQQANARELVEDALNFRREGMPCDVIGLEPGWMEKNYDYSIQKKWHPERFFFPSWDTTGPATFPSALKRLGFKLSLWLCCNYDLLFEEERRAGAALDGQEAADPARHADDYEQDEHFGHSPVLSDTLTNPKEAWFEHLKKFVDQGARAFKMDGALQVNEHPDRKWGSGLSSLPDGFMDDEEMHNLYPLLLNKQMSLGFSEHTGKRALIYSSGGYTGIGQYAATWAGDTGGGPRTLVSLLNHGLSGHSNTTVDMGAFAPDSIHFGFLQPWSQLNSWAYWRHPWLLGDELKPIFQFYAQFRYQLLPYLYTMAHVAHETGMPMLRALPLVYPKDPLGDELLNHYMLGDWLLSAAFSEELHLPEGAWYDYWTGEKHEGPKTWVYTPPEGRGGPLFVKAGAILPLGPASDYVGQKPLEEMELHVWPAGESQFTLYEDDGESLAYQVGDFAKTHFTVRETDTEVQVNIGERMGSYQGMPEKRSYRVVMHGTGGTKPLKLVTTS